MLGNAEFISCEIGNADVLLTYQVFGSENLVSTNSFTKPSLTVNKHKVL